MIPLNQRVHTLAFLIAAVVSFFLEACSSAPTRPPQRSATTEQTHGRDRFPVQKLEPNELAIVTTTDFHSALDRAEGLASVLRELKSRYGDQMFYLDAGDLFQGSMEGNLSKGRSIVDFFNLLPVDAAAIGNHELDYGPDLPGRTSVKDREDGLGNLKARTLQAKFKWLSANMIDVHGKQASCRADKARVGDRRCNALGQKTIFEPHAIFDRGGKKACVIGATTPGTPSITRPEFIRDIRFEPLEPIVAAETKFLREKEHCDLVLLVAHAGLMCAPTKDGPPQCKAEGDRAEILRLLRSLPPRTLDAVIAGHTHLLARETINGTPVIEAGTGGKFVGVLRLKGAHGDFEAHFEDFIPVPEKAEAPDVTAALKPYRDTAAEIKRRPVAISNGPLLRTYNAENPLGNLIADSLYEAAHDVANADFAIINAGGIRANLPAGEITYGHVFDALPFDNSLAVVTLTGAELKRVLEIAESGGHGLSPVSGLLVTRIDAHPGERVASNRSRDLNRDGKHEDWERDLLVQVTDLQGRPIDDRRTYKLATLDFLVSGGDHQAAAYDQIPAKRKRIFTDIWARDILADYLRKRAQIDPKDYFDPKHPRIVNTAAESNPK